MKPGLSALATWNPTCLGAAAGTVMDLRSTLDRAASDTEQSAAWTRRGWESAGADAAFAKIGEAQVATARLAMLCGELESALLSGEAEISRARSDAIEAAATARGEGFEVSDCGEVTPSASQVAAASATDGADSDSTGVELARRARAHTTAIRAALETVDVADLAATSAIDSVCAQMYETSPSPLGTVSTDLTTALASGPGWEFDPTVNPRTMAASAIIGGMTEATRIGAVNALDEAPDPVLKKLFGGVGDSLDDSLAKKALHGVSRAGAVGAVVGAVPAISDNINNGMDVPTAVGSEVAGAGAGLLAGAATGAAMGSFGGPVGIVGGFIVGAAFAGLASHGASKLVQSASRTMQEG